MANEETTADKRIVSTDNEILRTLVTLSVQMTHVNSAIQDMNIRISKIETDIKDRAEKNETTYVTRSEFVPYQRLLQGMVALMLTGVFSALLALVIKG